MKKKLSVLLFFASLYSACILAAPNYGIGSASIPDSIRNRYFSTTKIEEKINVLNDACFYLISRDPQLCIDISREVLRLSDSIKYSNGLIVANNNIGLAFYRTAKYRQSISCFQEGERIAKAEKNVVKQMSILSNLALVYNSLSDFERSLNFNFTALKSRIEMRDSAGIATSFNNIGMTYHLKGDYGVACNYYNRALEIKKALNDKDGIGNTYNNIGQTFFEMYTDTSKWAIDSAQYYFLKAYYAFNQTGNKVGLAQVLPNIANVYAQEEAADKALDAYRAALNAQKQIDDSAGIALSFYNMALLYNIEGDLIRAKEYFNRSITIARKFSITDLVRDNLRELFTLADKSANSKLASDYAREFLALNDSVDAMSRKMLIEAYNGKFAYQIFENEQLKKEVSNSRIWLIILTTITLTVLGLVFLWWLIKRKKQNEEA